MKIQERIQIEKSGTACPQAFFSPIALLSPMDEINY